MIANWKKVSESEIIPYGAKVLVLTPKRTFAEGVFIKHKPPTQREVIKYSLVRLGEVYVTMCTEDISVPKGTVLATDAETRPNSLDPEADESTETSGKDIPFKKRIGNMQNLEKDVLIGKLQQMERELQKLADAKNEHRTKTSVLVPRGDKQGKWS